MRLSLPLPRIGRRTRLAGAAVCLALALISAVDKGSAAPSPGARHAVVVTAKALPAGHALARSDLVVRSVSDVTTTPGRETRPDRLLGRRLAGPLARGEPVTRRRLVDAGLTAGLPPGTVALPVDVTTDVRGLVTPGGRIDLLSVAAGSGDGTDTSPGGADGSTPTATRLAARVLVLAALAADSSTDAGCRLVLALSRDDALRVAGARSSRLFQVAALSP